MKTLVYLLAFTFAILFASCDGKERARISTTEKIENSQLSKSFFEKTEYFPKEYTEKVTDTILKSGYAVNIHFYSDMNNAILNDFKIDTINYKHYYREFKATVSVSKNAKKIVSQDLDKATFIKNNPENKAFLDEAIMQFVEVNQETSTKNQAVIDVVFCKPESDDCLTYQMQVNQEGDYTLKLTDKSYYNEDI